ncbi:hypothetical protein [Thorsellia kenyensis]|uniref:Lipoprotein n=1 Tax=Thorsellia kenyensis TaxID=1549888 RepID=A0ABV6C973_9GAMM
MKSIKLLPIVAISFLLLGCGKEEVSCTNEEALNLLKSAYKQADTSEYYFRYNNKYELKDFNDALDLLKLGGVSVPNNKLFHEDNENFLQLLNSVNISFDNIITNEVDKDVNSYTCTADVFFEFENKEGEPVNLSTTGVPYLVFPMNDGEKIGIEYYEDSIENTRVDLVKYLIYAAGLEKPFDITFTNEEIEIIAEQAELRRLRIEKAEQDKLIIDEIYLRLTEEFPSPYLDTKIREHVVQLIADNFFKGKIVKNSDALIELYAKKNNIDMFELMSAQQIVESSESEKNAADEQEFQGDVSNMASYQENNIDEKLTSAIELVNSTNMGIYNYVRESLLTKINNDDFGDYYCKNNAFDVIGQADVEEGIAIKVCNQLYKKYGPSTSSTEIPFLYGILIENDLHLYDIASKK